MKKSKILCGVLSTALLLGIGQTAFAKTINDIPKNVLKIGSDFYSLNSDAFNDDQKLLNSISKGPDKNKAYFKAADGKWYNIFALDDNQIGNSQYAEANDKVVKWSVGTWYKTGSGVEEISPIVDFKFNDASITISSGDTVTADTVTVDTAQVVFDSNGLNGSVDLSKYTDMQYVKSGSVNPNTPGSLVVTSIKGSKTVNGQPVDGMDLLIKAGVNASVFIQTLEENKANPLNVIELLDKVDFGSNGVSIGALRDTFGDTLTFEGTFNSTPVKLTVRLMGTTTN